MRTKIERLREEKEHKKTLVNSMKDGNIEMHTLPDCTNKDYTKSRERYDEERLKDFYKSKIGNSLRNIEVNY
jgi:hypothetical protein